MKEKRIKALMVEPGKHPCVVELKNDLDSLQTAVSIGAPEQGLIEFVYIEDNVSILCNEEGKLIGLEPNRRLGEDILCGVFYVVAENNNGDLKSLTQEQQERYSKMFWDSDVIDKSDIERTVFSIFFGG
ncbi:MAG: DUF3846 domain-containing protein [Clostridia bacterium]|nr:DUF3846 domain-containing protein [Clostridia bacterium]